jgi:hypothetical protein
VLQRLSTHLSAVLELGVHIIRQVTDKNVRHAYSMQAAHPMCKVDDCTAARPGLRI